MLYANAVHTGSDYVSCCEACAKYTRQYLVITVLIVAVINIISIINGLSLPCQWDIYIYERFTFTFTFTKEKFHVFFLKNWQIYSTANFKNHSHKSIKFISNNQARKGLRPYVVTRKVIFYSKVSLSLIFVSLKSRTWQNFSSHDNSKLRKYNNLFANVVLSRSHYFACFSKIKT